MAENVVMYINVLYEIRHLVKLMQQKYNLTMIYIGGTIG